MQEAKTEPPTKKPKPKADTATSTPGARKPNKAARPPFFTLQLAADEAWAQFTNELTRTLANLGEEESLNITSGEDGYYVQFTGRGSSGIRAEAVSNTFLENHEKLSEQACGRLLMLGWKVPTEDSPSYFLNAAPPVRYSAVASLAVFTFLVVFRASHPGELQYKAWAKDGSFLQFPNLGIAAEAEGSDRRSTSL